MASEIADTARLTAELQHSQAYARAVLDSAPDAMVIVDAVGQIQRTNAELERLFGYTREELTGRSAELLIAHRRGADRGSRVGIFSLPRVRPAGAWRELIGRRKDGTEFPIEVSVRGFAAGRGLATAAIRDVTARKRVEADLHEANVEQLRVLNVELVERLSELETATQEQEQLHLELVEAQMEAAESLMLMQTLLSTAPVGFGFVDREFRIRHINETLAAINGSSIEDQLGRTLAEVLPGLWPAMEPVYRRVLDTGEAIVNRDLTSENRAWPGGLRAWLASYYPVRAGAEIVGIGVVVVEITERRQAEEFRLVVMQNMAEGLVVMDGEGRLMFMNAAASKMLGWSEDELLGSSTHAAIHYQHADGSLCIEKDCQLSKVRTDRRTVQMADDGFTRKDGSVFPVAYSAAPLLDGTTVRGVVVVFRDMTEQNAKRSRAQRELNTLTWVGRIRDALDDDRLVLYSQPIIPLTARASRSGELLVRMVGRDGQIIAPGAFLPVAEKYGQIAEIDHWVIRQAARLGAEGRHVQANLSADSVGNLDLLLRIERELSDAGTDPANIVFEITETALMGDVEAGKLFTRGIAEIGCATALDDFGTGFGSFTYLQKLHIAYIKIDIEFVRDLAANTTNQHLVKAIVNIAHGLGQRTIAEGVEDGETLDLLREYGVDLAQGFYLGRPQPLDRA